MNFFNGFLDDGRHGLHRGSQRYVDPLERANAQIYNLANENEALQARVEQLEHRLAQVARPTTPNPQQLIHRIRDLEGALGHTQRELAVSQQRLAAAEDALSKAAQRERSMGPRTGRTGMSRQNPSGQATSQGGMESTMGAPTLKKEGSLSQNGFYIQEEESVSVKDQQIRELKETIQELNRAYSDFPKYKQYYEAREGGLQSQQPPHSAMALEQAVPHTDDGLFEQCKAQGKAFFRGTMVEGKPQGPCTEVLQNGESFRGTYRDGVRNGPGVLETPDFTFEGEFVAGEPQRAQGNLRPKLKVATFRLNPFAEYTGQVVEGAPQGQGRLQFSNGAKIAGTFANGRLDEQYPATIQVPEWGDKAMEARLMPIPGLDAVVVKPLEASGQLIWNLQTGELKSI